MCRERKRGESEQYEQRERPRRGAGAVMCREKDRQAAMCRERQTEREK